VNDMISSARSSPDRAIVTCSSGSNDQDQTTTSHGRFVVVLEISTWEEDVLAYDARMPCLDGLLLPLVRDYSV